jgi:hypothetical protein
VVGDRVRGHDERRAGPSLAFCLPAIRSILERLSAIDIRAYELICVSASIEIHVYLQAGRVAWALDSEHPLAFAGQLQESGGIDPTALREVVASCRRERLPLGETLVAWGLSTWDGVRACLRHQIQLALRALGAVDAAETVFLSRTYRAYDERLTFDVHELLDPEHVSRAERALARPS